LYAGDWLTGDAQGRTLIDPATDIESNVYVDGDLHALLSDSTFGGVDDAGVAQPIYLTAFSVAVGGKLGVMKAIDSLIDSGTYVSNTAQGTGLGIPEYEDRRGNPPGGVTYFEGFNGSPSLGDTTNFYNDTFETAQYVSSGLSRAFGTDQVAIINGQVDSTAPINDTIDYYAVALLAGQTVSVQLTASPLLNRALGGANVTVFDPDGRLIDSDLTTPGVQQALKGHPFQFTADRPGAYRFAVSGTAQYTLRLTGIANIGLGGVVMGNNLLTYNSSITPFQVHRGDLGAYDVTNNLMDISFLANTVDKGNLRAVSAGSIGLALTTDLTQG